MQQSAVPYRSNRVEIDRGSNAKIFSDRKLIPKRADQLTARRPTIKNQVQQPEITGPRRSSSQGLHSAALSRSNRVEIDPINNERIFEYGNPIPVGLSYLRIGVRVSQLVAAYPPPIGQLHPTFFMIGFGRGPFRYLSGAFQSNCEDPMIVSIFGSFRDEAAAEAGREQALTAFAACKVKQTVLGTVLEWTDINGFEVCIRGQSLNIQRAEKDKTQYAREVKIITSGQVHHELSPIQRGRNNDPLFGKEENSSHTLTPKIKVWPYVLIVGIIGILGIAIGTGVVIVLLAWPSSVGKPLTPISLSKSYDKPIFKRGSPYPLGYDAVRIGDRLSKFKSQYPESTDFSAPIKDGPFDWALFHHSSDSYDPNIHSITFHLRDSNAADTVRKQALSTFAPAKADQKDLGKILEWKNIGGASVKLTNDYYIVEAVRK